MSSHVAALALTGSKKQFTLLPQQVCFKNEDDADGGAFQGIYEWS